MDMMWFAGGGPLMQCFPPVYSLVQGAPAGQIIFGSPPLISRLVGELHAYNPTCTLKVCQYWCVMATAWLNCHMHT